MKHSAIHLTCIKQYLVLKTNFGLFENDHFTQVLLYKKLLHISSDEWSELKTFWQNGHKVTYKNS